MINLKCYNSLNGLYAVQFSEMNFKLYIIYKCCLVFLIQKAQLYHDLYIQNVTIIALFAYGNIFLPLFLLKDLLQNLLNICCNLTPLISVKLKRWMSSSPNIFSNLWNVIRSFSIIWNTYSLSTHHLQICKNCLSNYYVNF